MGYDDTKLQEAVLALLGAFEFDDGRTWKRYDFSIMDELHKQGMITDPRGRSESVHLTQAGRLKGKALAARLFGAGTDQ